MRDVQLASGRSLTETLTIKTPPEKDLFCECCANEVHQQLTNLKGLRVDVFPVLLLCGPMRCDRCNKRTGNLAEVREV